MSMTPDPDTSDEELGALLQEPVGAGAASHHHSPGTLKAVLQAVFCLQEASLGNTPVVKPGIVILLFSIWTIVMLYCLTGLMGPGVRDFVFIQVPVFLALPLVVTVKKRLFGVSRNRAYFICYSVAALPYLVLLWFATEDLEWYDFLVLPLVALTAIIGVFPLIRYLFQQLMRTFQRSIREEDPSAHFWQRIDTWLVRLLRGIFVLLLVGYNFRVAVVGNVMEVTLLDTGSSVLVVVHENSLPLLLLALSYGSLLYFVVATLMVRDRPANRIQREFPTAISNNVVRLRQQVQQFALNPNDPLGEPLLLV